MLKKLVNEAYFTLRITTMGPLLVRSGHASISGPDMTPVLTTRGKEQEIFLPGSSLKGVFRSHSEKIVCSLKPHVVCYPFFGNEDKEADHPQRQQDYRDSCGERFNQFAKQDDANRKQMEARTDWVYEQSCPTCRLFGSTGFIGRVAIGDAYLAPGSRAVTELRDGVGIDRLTGGASHGAKFELEVVSRDVTFETDVHLRNFEIWQLGMLFVVLQDMQDELIRIGSGRSRGLGKVTAEISNQGRKGRPGGFVISNVRDDDNVRGELWGLGRWLDNASYGTWKDDLLSLPAGKADNGQSEIVRGRRGIRWERAFTGQALAGLSKAAIDQFVQRMQSWPEQQDLALLTTSRRDV
jgi:CRISPR-associated RAMP protein (TIGR02581 family)